MGAAPSALPYNRGGRTVALPDVLQALRALRSSTPHPAS
jgi:hypothetical protein